MRLVITMLGLLTYQSVLAQASLTAALPEKLDTLEALIYVAHFPPRVNVSQDADRPGEYFWKHTTSMLSVETVEVVEFGAYIFYNDQWNLRATYGPKQFKKWFRTKSCILKGGEPYTYPDNWRSQREIFGGWALWYVIVEDEDGEIYCGYARLDTTGEILSQENITNQ